MITAAAFFLFLGLIVFGPKKTIEMAQLVGRALAQVKHASGEFQSQIAEEGLIPPQGESKPTGGAV